MNPKVDEFIAKKSRWTKELTELREIFLSTDLEETIKWGSPVYTINGKNVAGLSAFKNHYGLWFFNGVFLKDKHNLLVNAQEKTKAMRQVKFEEGDKIPKKIILEYILEARDNELEGKKVALAAPGKYELSPFLEEAFKSDQVLLDGFYALSPGKQKDYSNHISDAKQEKTKLSRLEKIKPMILQGIGLHDKYKNC